MTKQTIKRGKTQVTVKRFMPMKLPRGARLRDFNLYWLNDSKDEDE